MEQNRISRAMEENHDEEILTRGSHDSTSLHTAQCGFILSDHHRNSLGSKAMLMPPSWYAYMHFEPLAMKIQRAEKSSQPCRRLPTQASVSNHRHLHRKQHFYSGSFRSYGPLHYSIGLCDIDMFFKGKHIIAKHCKVQNEDQDNERCKENRSLARYDLSQSPCYSRAFHTSHSLRRFPH